MEQYSIFHIIYREFFHLLQLSDFTMEKKGCCIFDSAEFRANIVDLELAQCMLKGRVPVFDPHVICKYISCVLSTTKFS